MKDEMIGLEMELRRGKREKSEIEGHPGPVMKLNEKQRLCLGRNRNRFIEMFQLFLCYTATCGVKISDTVQGSV